MRILITGETGYIAKHFAAYLKKRGIEYTMLSLRGDNWRSFSLKGYDAVLHTAGIVHKKESGHNQYDYYIINRDLSEELAVKAKKDSVKQFVFISSMSVYGINTGVIKPDTKPVPKTHYGRSKLAAESLLSPLASESFNVAILRPPMVYGPNCPGNFGSLCSLLKRTPIFPSCANLRDMVFVGNLCEHIYHIISNNKSGLFFPRDIEPLSTKDIAAAVAEAQGKTILFTNIFNPLINIAVKLSSNMAKVFGSLYYCPSIPNSGGSGLVDSKAAIAVSVNAENA